MKVCTCKCLLNNSICTQTYVFAVVILFCSGPRRQGRAGGKAGKKVQHLQGRVWGYKKEGRNSWDAWLARMLRLGHAKLEFC